MGIYQAYFKRFYPLYPTSTNYRYMSTSEKRFLRASVNRRPGVQRTREGVRSDSWLSKRECAMISAAIVTTAMTSREPTGRSKLARLPEASNALITPKMPRKLWKAMVPYTSLETKKNRLVRSPITVRNTTKPIVLNGGL